MRLRGKLRACEPLSLPFGMGTGNFAGGDSMLTRCLAELGIRCNTDYDLGLHRKGTCPFAHGCSLTALFRKNPPWLYTAVRRHVGSNRAAVKQIELFDGLGLDAPLQETVAFHHVRPTARASGLGTDPRCAIRLRADRKGNARWWASTCLPNFCILGTPRSSYPALLDAILSHKDVLTPTRRTLRFFSKAALVEAAAHLSVPSPTFLTKLVATYSDLFPSIDPRDFVITGEGSPGYLYSPLAFAFFGTSYMRLTRLLVILREPAIRSILALQR